MSTMADNCFAPDRTTFGGPRAWSGHRILAEGKYAANDTRETKLNNNDLIIGPTGSGKTRYYVKPNLLQANESVIVTDTKGSLRHEVGHALEALGYDVLDIDFAAMGGTCGYNPLDYVGADPQTGRVSQRDIMTIADALVPIENGTDPFWDLAAKSLLTCLIGYAMESSDTVGGGGPSLADVAELQAGIIPCKGGLGGPTPMKLEKFSAERPESLTALKWNSFKTSGAAGRMVASILGILSEKLDSFTYDSCIRMMTMERRLDFGGLGRKKTALFLTVSDTDRSADRLVNLFYSQAIHGLCSYADTQCGGSLPVPVRMYLDDFATNCVIPDFDNIVSVIRSRNLAVSIILQSLTQLRGIYGSARAATIGNCCDHWLYLGGQDLETSRVISTMANKAIETILYMPVDEALLFERGTTPAAVRRYDLASHERYGLLEGEAPLAELDTDINAF